MGVTPYSAQLLVCCSSASNSPMEKVNFARTLTLGRQKIFANEHELRKLFMKYFSKEFVSSECEKFLSELRDGNLYSEPFFKLLAHNGGGGDLVTESIDYSDYESATILHDLQVSVPNELKNRFTCVYDGGLLEHVYDFPVALKNAMDMVAVGGHLILGKPCNNWVGHGFYQFSPELFYTVLREENGFTDTKVYSCDGQKWYLAKNPRVTHRRTEYNPRWRAMLYVVSRKIKNVPVLAPVFQSDYEEITWKDKISATDMPRDRSNAKHIAKEILRKIFTHSMYNRIMLYYDDRIKRRNDFLRIKDF